MIRAFRIHAAVLLGATALQPAAANADQAGVARIRAALEAYVGTSVFEREALTVTSEGTGYRIAFDIAPLLAAMTMPAGTSPSLGPISILVSERSDGDWNVGGDSALSFQFGTEIEGKPRSVDFQMKESPFRAIWSPTLRAFISSSGQSGAGRGEIVEPDGTTLFEFGPGTIDTEASGTASDLTVNIRQAISDFRETVTVNIPEGDDAGGFSFNISAASAEQKGTISGLRNSSILDIWSFLVSNSDEGGETIKAKQEELRSLLVAALPLWGEMDSVATLHDLAIGFDQGSATAAMASYGGVFDGLGDAGDYTFSFAFAGLNLNSPRVPAWTSPLLPKDVSFAVTMTDVDLETPARIALDSFDLRQDDIIPAEAAERIAATFQGKPLSFLVEPGFIRGTDYSFDFEGEIEVKGKDADINIDVTASGLDALIAAVQAAGTPEAMQAAGGLTFAKGFGRAQPDGTTRWEIEAKSDGSVRVNGTQLSPPRR